ncbi:CPBP family intramembrane metalloprotease [Micromonospora polyrhachis]|uniref:Membrane protease YdiL (CAAX protease family) n=1 Tax=Micromonospora polyrhachis TaxID=1282883 RepID=A0A7W7SS45_9ACTN|nr:CPBP family intramembrane glutamic endopeptidase [Micromonospora polyrhachis]MBB4959307.1 membrane protease YdiL (CAAX protease family) [Micromonospora polyrhachis]
MTSQKKGLLVFLAISFGGAWSYLLVARMVFDWSLVNALVQLPFAFAPAIAAVVVRRWVTREGFGDAGLALRLRRSWPYYLLAWFGPLLLVAATVGLAGVLGLWDGDLSALDDLVPGLPGWVALLALMAGVLLLTPFYWGEEFGWTSYLRLRIFVDRPLLSVTVTGLVWAVWHYPLAFLGYIEFDNVPLGLLAWTVSFLCQEMILAWLRLRSDSIWVPSLAHAGNNMVLAMLTGMLLAGGGKIDEVGLILLAAVPMAAICIWLLVSGQFTRHFSRQVSRIQVVDDRTGRGKPVELAERH